MFATRTSAANSGTTTAVTMSSIIAQTTKIYNIVLMFFIFIFIVVCSVSVCFCIWLKKRKTNNTATNAPQFENAIPLATFNKTLPPSPKPSIPARNPQRSVMTPSHASSHTQTQPTQTKLTRPTQSKRAQTTLPPLPLSQRPVLRHNQTYGSDYSSGRPRRYGDDHPSQSGPSVSANVHGNSAFENPGTRKLDKINNS